MKRLILSATWLLVATAAFAQADSTRYFLPNGKEVAKNKLDSVNKSWGNKGFVMGHDDKHPHEIHLSPMNDDFIKQFEAKKAELGKMLNQPAPDFTLVDIDGKQWTLSALKGKTVVLNFWFTTCPPCIEEMPKLNELQKSYAGSNVIFLGLALDDRDAIKKFRQQHPFTYTLFPKTTHVGMAFHVGNYPTSVVIDPKGIIRYQQIGGQDIKKELKTAIDQVSGI